MLRIAWKNLIHDKLKLTTAVLGVVFATFLMTVQVGMLLGFMHTITGIVDHSPGDLWIMPEHTPNFEMVLGQPERRYYQAQAVPGVSWASRLIVDFTIWKTPSGQMEQVVLIGVDPERPVGLPWDMEEGSVDGIWDRYGVIVDSLERERLGGQRPLEVGEDVEILFNRARVAGFSRGVRSFTTTPFVFTSLKFARDYAWGMRPQDQVKYVVVGVEPGYDVEQVRRDLVARFDDAEVLTRDAFMRRSVVYWLLGTGAGLMSILAAVLGLLVGGAIVGQSIYSQTMERFREYGTFKALGGTNAELAGIILTQALITSLLGFAASVVVSRVFVHTFGQGKVLIELPAPVLAALGGVTVLMCAVASLTSVARVVRLEPYYVFKA